MAVFDRDQYERFWRSEIPKVHNAGRGQLRGCCPGHGGDSDNTLSIDLETGMAHCFKCHASGGAWTMVDFAMVRYGFSRASAVDYVRGVVGQIKSSAVRPWNFPFPKPLGITTNDWQLGCLAKSIEFFAQKFDAEADQEGRCSPGWHCTALYPYEPAYSVKLRFTHPEKAKRMIWLSLTEKGGWSRPSKTGRQAGLYRAHALAGAKEIWLLNGEKAVDRAVAEWGLIATCLPNGEGHWKDEYLVSLKDAGMVFIVCDNDATGSEHGRMVGAALARASIDTRMAALPGVEAKGDLWDFMEAGHTLEEARAALADGIAGDANYVAVAMASRNGRPAAPPPSPPEGAPAAAEGPDLTQFEKNDSGNAQRLIRFSEDSVRYVYNVQTWFIWNGACWEPDESGRIYSIAKAAMRLVEVQANSAGDDSLFKFAYHSLNKGPILNMVTLARDLAAISYEELDAHPSLIPCLNGTFDAATGELREHRKEDLITRLFPCRYNPQLAPPNLFLRVLDEAMGGGAEASEEDLDRAGRMIDYLRQVFYYCATGEISQKLFFCFWGESGNNAKTTILTFLVRLWGRYAVRIDALTLTNSARQNDNNKRADLVRTKGARLIVASEPPEGTRFDQAVIKLLTQGESKVTGALKYQNPVEFMPTGKIMLEANEVPRIDTSDRAFMRRMHIIEHRVEIPEERIDAELPAKLLRERDQAFSWILGVWKEAQGAAIERPIDMAHTLGKIEELNANRDGFVDFLDECFERGGGETTGCKPQEAHQIHVGWAVKNHQKVWDIRYFMKRLRQVKEIQVDDPPGKRKGDRGWIRGITPKEKAVAAPVGRDAQYRDD